MATMNTMRLTFRLTRQDLDALDRIRGFCTRSEALRRLIREASGTAGPQSRELAELHDRIRAADAAARAEAADLVRQARRLSTGK